MTVHIVGFVEYVVDRKLFGYNNVKEIVTCWKAFIAKFHNLFPSLTQTVYMCLFVCVYESDFVLAFRYMTTGLSCVWSPFDAYSDYCSVLRGWVI